MPIDRKIGIRDYASTFATGLAIQACTLIQGVLLARILGPLGRGEFVAITLWPAFFASLCSMGLPIAVARRSAKDRNVSTLIKASLSLTLATSGLGILICALMLPWLIPSTEGRVLNGAIWYMPFIVLNQLTLTLMAVDQGRGDFSKFNWTRLIVNPVFLAGIVLLWLCGIKNPFAYAMALLAANAMVAVVRVVGAVAPLREFRQPEGASVVGVKDLLKESVPYGVAGLIGPLFQQADKVLLLFLLGTTQLGIYSVAMTAGVVGGTLSSTASTVVFGVSVQAGDRGGYEQIARIFRLSCWVWLLTGVGLIIVIPLLLPVIYGKAFLPAIVPALFLVPASAVGGQAGILEEALRAQGQAFIGVKGRVLGLIVMIVMGFALVPFLGLLGVVLGFVFAQIVVLGVMAFSFGLHFNVSALKTLTPRFSELVELLQRSLDFGQKFIKLRT